MYTGSRGPGTLVITAVPFAENMSTIRLLDRLGVSPTAAQDPVDEADPQASP